MSNRVHCIFEFWDRPRSGIADFNGIPHYFSCQWNELEDDFSDVYSLRIIGNDMFELLNEYEEIWNEWCNGFYEGKQLQAEHPGIDGVNPRFAELQNRIDFSLKHKNVVARAIPDFQSLPGQDCKPKGMIRDMLVIWRVVA